ncbi:hypothetical protein EYC84_001947 [Monilinia fructicola]|uniref:Uncharacterized protein n=1 Tax=Monilinia fructicola TaxID=38448 RepID=A0A5M9JVW2_MONFR|nr:hypothetical protein EYC84_001947 [Monilinia fructicola]
MAPYLPSEKAHLLCLCAIHGITGNYHAPHMAWPKVLFDMNAEAPRHLVGGDLFDTDPWPIRRYTLTSIRRVYTQRQSVVRFPIIGADPGPREGGVDLQKMTIGFVLNDEQSEQSRPEAIVAEHRNPQPQVSRPRRHPHGLRLPSLRQVLNSPNDYPQPILNRNTRVIQHRLRQANRRNGLPDAPARPALDNRTAGPLWR